MRDALTPTEEAVDVASTQAMLAMNLGLPRSTRNEVVANLIAAVRADEKARCGADTERLDWLLNEIQFDELDGRDAHDEAMRIALDAGMDEPDDSTYLGARRSLIDAARRANA